MILLIKEKIKKEIAEALAVYNISKEEIVVENIKEFKNGDFACPCFTLAKTLKKAPAQIAEEIKTNINNENYENVEVVGGYINFFLKKEKTAINLLEKILKEKEAYGNLNYGDNKTIVLDYSAPNIAKPFGVAHLRSTAIGNSLNKLLTKIGYKTVSINYIGDFGSQFGKMICAYKLWGVKSIVEKNPIQELKKLYVKFHAEAEKMKVWMTKVGNGLKD